MEKIAFRRLPLVVRVMTCLSMFMGWVLLAEFVIDRYGVHQYLPFYRYANVCPYDIIAALLIVLFWIRAHARA